VFNFHNLIKFWARKDPKLIFHEIKILNYWLIHFWLWLLWFFPRSKLVL